LGQNIDTRALSVRVRDTSPASYLMVKERGELSSVPYLE